MKRLGHGEIKKSALAPQAPQGLAAQSIGPEKAVERFDYMFAGWTAEDRLPQTKETLAQLRVLGGAMKDSEGEASDSGIPAAYTYFGQFLDHDITLDTTSGTIADLDDPALQPLRDLAGLRNERTAATELDSVYFLGVPRQQDKKNRLRLSAVSNLNGNAPPLLRPAGKKDLNDLPRQARHADKDEDRAAIIGDPRNDENTIVAQLHTAFLKAHNTLVDGGLDFDQARREMILRYQSVILDDFLPKICHEATYQKIRKDGPAFWVVDKREDLFMPAEFAFAAYRFGHSMVRTNYDFNINFNPSGPPGAPLDFLFVFTALSGQLGFQGQETDTLPENWIIEWERILPVESGGAVQNAHAIDTRLTNFLFELRDKLGNKETGELAPLLATRNLLRGYLVGLPTGQAVAKAMGLVPLSGVVLEASLPTQALKDAAKPFLDRSPLWFYVLAEAGANSGQGGGDGKRLGEVGSTIVMETLYNLVKHSEVSILTEPSAKDLKTSLADIIALAAKQDA